MVKINGEMVSVQGISVLDYLLENGYQADRVVVEKNLIILTKDQLETTVIEDGDVIEVLSFVGGG